MAPLPALPFHLINAFAASPHGGNQAAVVLLPSASDPRATDEKWMRTVAADFNLSETAFLVPQKGDGDEVVYGLRWFTPVVEVPLCGHATFAAAYTLFNYVHPTTRKLRFETRWRGSLFASLESPVGQGAKVGLSLPFHPTLTTPECAGWAKLNERVLGVDVLDTVQFESSGPCTLVQVAEGVDLAGLKVKPAEYLPELGLATVTQVLSEGSTPDRVRITSRVFAPGLGIDEDPVTGSVWAIIAGHYLVGEGVEATRRVIGKDADVSKVTIEARQLSARGGALDITVADGRAQLVGQGWRYGHGELDVLE